MRTKIHLFGYIFYGDAAFKVVESVNVYVVNFIGIG